MELDWTENTYERICREHEENSRKAYNRMVSKKDQIGS